MIKKVIVLVIFLGLSVPFLAQSATQTGWYGRYYNYSKTHPDMDLPGSFWPDADHGDPLGSWDTDWYNSTYFRFDRIDRNLTFGENFFPFDEIMEEIDTGHERHFGAHWQAQVSTQQPGAYEFTLTSDDDTWVYLDGILVAENPGIHAPRTITTSIAISNKHIVDIFFADRRALQSHMYFKFTNEAALTISPTQSPRNPLEMDQPPEEDRDAQPEEDTPPSQIDVNPRNFGLVVAPNKGEKPYLKIFDRQGNFRREFLVYDEEFDEGVNLVVGDLGEDRKAEIVVAPAFGAEPLVKIFRSDGSLLNSFMAYEDNFHGGVNIALGDIDGDGKAEIITGSGVGGSLIKVFRYDNGSYSSISNGFFAYNVNYNQGVKVAAGDLNGDGKAEIITGTEIGGGPHIRVFDGEGSLKFSPGFFAYREDLRQGIKVAAGDLDGDGKAEIITGTNLGLGPHVRVFNPFGNIKFTPGFFAYDERFRGGVNVATADLNLDGRDEIITGAGPGGGPHVRIFDRYGETRINAGFFAYPQEYRSGIQVGGGILDL